MAYLSATYITCSILGLQILTFITMMTWWRWTEPRLARDPDTLLGVWTLLAASDIREDFDDLGTAGRQDLVNTVTRWDKRYWLGEATGKDGVTRMSIHSDKEHDDTPPYESFHREHPALAGSVAPTIPSPTIPQITISPDI
jgi:hypothetical protein